MEHLLLWYAKLLEIIKTILPFNLTLITTASAVRSSGVAFLALLISMAAPTALAQSNDSVRYAKRLLRVSGTAEQFESAAQQQTRAIIRTYLSIVNMSVDVKLPDHVTSSIAACYDATYAWGNFEDGVAEIVSQQLTDKEMLLLIDFYNDLGLPSSEIDTFKTTLDKMSSIREFSANFIFDQSIGCVDQDAEIINRYLTSVGSPLPPTPAFQ